MAGRLDLTTGKCRVVVRPRLRHHLHSSRANKKRATRRRKATDRTIQRGRRPGGGGMSRRARHTPSASAGLLMHSHFPEPWQLPSIRQRSAQARCSQAKPSPHCRSFLQGWPRAKRSVHRPNFVQKDPQGQSLSTWQMPPVAGIQSGAWQCLVRGSQWLPAGQAAVGAAQGLRAAFGAQRPALQYPVTQAACSKHSEPTAIIMQGGERGREGTREGTIGTSVYADGRC